MTQFNTVNSAAKTLWIPPAHLTGSDIITTINDRLRRIDSPTLHPDWPYNGSVK